MKWKMLNINYNTSFHNNKLVRQGIIRTGYIYSIYGNDVKTLIKKAQFWKIKFILIDTDVSWLNINIDLNIIKIHAPYHIYLKTKYIFKHNINDNILE